MESTVEHTVDVLIVVGLTAYALTALCCVYAMWTLRKQFFIALRSPLLGCLMGATITFRAWAGASYLLILQNWNSEEVFELTRISAVFRIIFSPASLASVGAMIAWVVRLLVMYDPTRRRKWGRYTNEKRMFRGLVWMYVLLEVGAWTSVGMFGLIWTAWHLVFLDMASTLATLVAAVMLTGKLRKVHDLCRLSSDTQRIGALMVWPIFFYVVLFIPSLPALLFKYTAIFLTIAPLVIVWTTNIKPIRDYLRQRDHDSRRGIPLFLWRPITGGKIPSHGNSGGRVACTIDHKKSRATRQGLGSSAPGHHRESPLAAVMDFLPLQQAFGEYCRKALCSESFQFLVDVSEFRSAVPAAHGVDGESTNDDFDEFIAIVNEYIKGGSNSEVNIGGTTKEKILGFCERSAYGTLSLDERESIFLPAEREVAKMLAENLLNNFEVTTEYKELAGDMVFEKD